MERKQVVDYNSTIYFDGNTLSEIIDELQDLMKTYGNLTMHHGYAHQYDETERHYVSIMRPETDAEMQDRLDNERRYLDREREEYLRLKKQFEGK